MKTVIVYTKPSCSSSRKAIKFFKENNIPYREIKLGKDNTIPKSHLEIMMESSENGFEDLVKKPALKEVLDLSTEACKTYIIENPTILKTPAVVQGLKSYSGYNVDDYGMFLTRATRVREFQEAKKLLQAI